MEVLNYLTRKSTRRYSRITVKKVNDLIKDIRNKIETDDDDDKQLNALSKKVTNGLVNADKRNKVAKIIKALEPSITCYQEILDEAEKEKNKTKIEVKESDEEPLNPIETKDESEETVDDIEMRLDGEIDKYDYDENNPMRGINWNEKKEKYVVYLVSNGKIILNTTCVKLEDGCEKVITEIQKIYSRYTFINMFISDQAMENINGSRKKSEMNNEKEDLSIAQIPRYTFCYHDIDFICYYHDTEFYFDIYHIIKTFDVSDQQRDNIIKKNQLKIKCAIWSKNEHDGYIMRRLVNEAVMYQIILDSRSKFAKSFKEDVAKMLVKLRRTNRLSITNEALVITEKQKGQSEIPNSMTDHRYYQYTNPDDTKTIYSLIKAFMYEKIGHCMKENVIYCFVIPLDNAFRYIIIKFGFTGNIINRYTSLKREYGCKIFLIRLKRIKNEDVEKSFHEAIKKMYPNLPYKVFFKGKKDQEKTELYHFNPILLSFFDSYNFELNQSHIVNDYQFTKDEKTELDEMTVSGSIFIDMLHGMCLENSDEVIRRLESIENNKYDMEMARMRYAHEEIMEDKKIQLEKEKQKSDENVIRIEKEKQITLDKQNKVIANQIKLAKINSTKRK